MYYIYIIQYEKIITIYLYLFIAFTCICWIDGELNFQKKSNQIKDCFEPLNRATFALTKVLDKVIFKPVAKGYRVYLHH